MVAGANADPATRAVAGRGNEDASTPGVSPEQGTAEPGLGPASQLMPLSWSWFEQQVLPTLGPSDLALLVLPTEASHSTEWNASLPAAGEEACTRLAARVATTGCRMAHLRVGEAAEGGRSDALFAAAADAHSSHQACVRVPLPARADSWWAQALTSFACKLCLNAVSTGAW